ncbi:hypothetical protein EMEDMD4_1340019 [Sinorhizobium medicae]|uniref:Uncharacterized protein n=1 Tax=Sinorhizobium medicae TaxID=110321 RepID=A0A508WWX8_9HYPH|nr:hypothetical protein EMEDMD4_1340019 [Sinorhizobium medicae]
MPGPGDHLIFVRITAYSGIMSNGERTTQIEETYLM